MKDLLIKTKEVSKIRKELIEVDKALLEVKNNKEYNSLIDKRTGLLIALKSTCNYIERLVGYELE